MIKLNFYQDHFAAVCRRKLLGLSARSPPAKPEEAEGALGKE